MSWMFSGIYFVSHCTINIWHNMQCNLLNTYNNNNYYYYYIGVRCARPGESENTLSVGRPQPHTTNPLKEEKDKIVWDKKERADHANRKALALSALEARQSHTIKNRVTKIVPKRQREGHKGSAIDTEKSYNEEAQTSAYEHPKHHE